MPVGDSGLISQELFLYRHLMPRPQMPQYPSPLVPRIPLWMGKETQRWLWSKGCWIQSLWSGLASAESGHGVLAEGASLSLAHCMLRRGSEGSQRSFPLTQWPFSSQRSSPRRQGTSMWHWPLCQPTCMPPCTVKALC